LSRNAFGVVGIGIREKILNKGFGAVKCPERASWQSPGLSGAFCRSTLGSGADAINPERVVCGLIPFGVTAWAQQGQHETHLFSNRELGTCFFN
jgi:hypothetical protein